ncbi:MAG: DNA polymerase III subunit gamma/tau [Verrucomicrobia bacterium]|nr:DNA polymerase III subunit gamma/tau [Verrucomicrobiota bacterium]
MAYQVIARKYRPQRFEDVVGQEHVTRTLSNAIIQNRIAHAYLFVGPRGTGKTTIARIFSKCLNCTDGPRVDFADDDPRCVEISEGRSLDVLEIDGASNRGIDEIRELRDTAVYAPVSGRFKIYIIDEVHMLTREAFNALLKTLEEPPPHVKFMFATTEPEKVLPTILSRCQRFDLKRIPVPLIVKQLSYICKNEGVDADEPALEAIARGAEGCLRDAESTLDQLISFCGNKLQESDVLSAFGLVSRGEIQKLSESILDGDLFSALKTLHFLLDNGKDISRLNSDLLAHFRNLSLFQISKGDRSLMEVSESEWNCIQSQASKITMEGVTRVMDILLANEWKLAQAVSRSVVMELSIVEAVQARSAVSIEDLLKRLGQLRDSVQPAAPVSVPQNPVAPPAYTPPPQAALVKNTEYVPRTMPTYSGMAKVKAPASQSRSAATPPVSAPSRELEAAVKDLPAFWQKMKDFLRKENRFLYNFLKGAVPMALTENSFELGISQEDFSDQMFLDDPSNKKILEGYLISCGFSRCRVVFRTCDSAKSQRQMLEEEQPAETSVENKVVEESVPQSVAPQVEEPLEALTEVSAPPVVEPIDFKNDPLIKEALERFNASIVQTGVSKTPKNS